VVLFAFGRQIQFSTDYASLVGKPYSVSEPLFLRDLDNRNVLDHLLTITITKDPEKASLNKENVVNDISTFMNLYRFGFYSVEINIDKQTIVKAESITKFCGKIQENNCGFDGKQPCIGYCEPIRYETTARTTVVNGITYTTGYDSVAKCGNPGRTKYVAGKSLCSNVEICCTEKNYNWQTRQYTGFDLKKGERACFDGKGICAPYDTPGRHLVQAYDKDCEVSVAYGVATRKEHCYIPINPSEITVSSDLGAEINIPLLYKKTKQDNDGVLGHVTVGVSRD
jgi:hypothetical protein